MVAEKIEATLSLQALALTGGLGTSAQSTAQTALRHYRRRVQANRGGWLDVERVLMIRTAGWQLDLD